jgi:hypothetical protein
MKFWILRILSVLFGIERKHSLLHWERTSYKCYYTAQRRVNIVWNLGFLYVSRRIHQTELNVEVNEFSSSATERSVRSLPSTFSLHHFPEPTRLRGVLLSNNKLLSLSFSLKTFGVRICCSFHKMFFSLLFSSDNSCFWFSRLVNSPLFFRAALCWPHHLQWLSTDNLPIQQRLFFVIFSDFAFSFPF